MAITFFFNRSNISRYLLDMSDLRFSVLFFYNRTRAHKRCLFRNIILLLLSFIVIINIIIIIIIIIIVIIILMNIIFGCLVSTFWRILYT